MIDLMIFTNIGICISTVAVKIYKIYRVGLEEKEKKNACIFLF